MLVWEIFLGLIVLVGLVERLRVRKPVGERYVKLGEFLVSILEDWGE